MLASLLAAPSIEVTVAEDQLFICPLPSDFPSSDPVLRGVVTISLPSPRAIKEIRVVLQGKCELYETEGWKYEPQVTLRKELLDEVGGEALPEGKHSFDFSFIIPCSTAVSNRSKYGHVRHHIMAEAVLDRGFLKRTLISKPIPLWIVANPSPQGELPVPTEVLLQYSDECLGPLAISFSSRHLTVSSLCRVQVYLPELPRPVSILAIETFITQGFSLQFKDGKTLEPPPAKRCLIEVNPSSSSMSSASSSTSTTTSEPLFPALHASGESYTFNRIYRVPGDDLIRPTTLQGTETPLRIAHTCSVRLRYLLEEQDEEQTITITKPVQIASCVCSPDAVFLPAYTATSPAQLNRGPLESRCSCRMSLKEVLERDGEALQQV
ncbi:hypothetical protein JCM8547_006097 [Rhodosporidiobolus lusitaniae]